MQGSRSSQETTSRNDKLLKWSTYSSRPKAVYPFPQPGLSRMRWRPSPGQPSTMPGIQPHNYAIHANELATCRGCAEDVDLNPRVSTRPAPAATGIHVDPFVDTFVDEQPPQVNASRAITNSPAFEPAPTINIHNNYVISQWPLDSSGLTRLG